MVRHTLSGIILATLTLAATSSQATTLVADTNNDGDYQFGFYDTYFGGVPSLWGSTIGAVPVVATYSDGSTESFYGFDLDYSTQHLAGSSYSVTATPFAMTVGALSSVQISNIQYLFEFAMPWTNDFDDISRTAGIGLALWEILYETSGSYSLDDGAFYAVLYDDTVPAEGLGLAFGRSLLTQIESGVPPSTNRYRVTFWESDGHVSNNFVSVSAVPLPATGLLLIGAGAALAGLRRRREKAKA